MGNKQGGTKMAAAEGSGGHTMPQHSRHSLREIRPSKRASGKSGPHHVGGDVDDDDDDDNDDDDHPHDLHVHSSALRAMHVRSAVAALDSSPSGHHVRLPGDRGGGGNSGGGGGGGGYTIPNTDPDSSLLSRILGEELHPHATSCQPSRRGAESGSGGFGGSGGDVDDSCVDVAYSSDVSCSRHSGDVTCPFPSPSSSRRRRVNVNVNAVRSHDQHNPPGSSTPAENALAHHFPDIIPTAPGSFPKRFCLESAAGPLHSSSNLDSDLSPAPNTMDSCLDRLESLKRDITQNDNPGNVTHFNNTGFAQLQSGEGDDYYDNTTDDNSSSPPSSITRPTTSSAHPKLSVWFNEESNSSEYGRRNKSEAVRKLSEPSQSLYRIDGVSAKSLLAAAGGCGWSKSAENSPVIVRKALPNPGNPVVVQRTPSQSPSVERRFPANSCGQDRGGQNKQDVDRVQGQAQAQAQVRPLALFTALSKHLETTREAPHSVRQKVTAEICVPAFSSAAAATTSTGAISPASVRKMPESPILFSSSVPGGKGRITTTDRSEKQQWRYPEGERHPPHHHHQVAPFMSVQTPRRQGGLKVLTSSSCSSSENELCDGRRLWWSHKEKESLTPSPIIIPSTSSSKSSSYFRPQKENVSPASPLFKDSSGSARPQDKGSSFVASPSSSTGTSPTSQPYPAAAVISSAPKPITFCLQPKGTPVRTCTLVGSPPSTAVMLLASRDSSTGRSLEGRETDAKECAGGVTPSPGRGELTSGEINRGEIVSRGDSARDQQHASACESIPTTTITTATTQNCTKFGNSTSSSSPPPPPSSASSSSSSTAAAVAAATSQTTAQPTPSPGVTEDTIKQNSQSAVFGSVSPKLLRHRRLLNDNGSHPQPSSPDSQFPCTRPNLPETCPRHGHLWCAVCPLVDAEGEESLEHLSHSAPSSFSLHGLKNDPSGSNKTLGQRIREVITEATVVRPTRAVADTRHHHQPSAAFAKVFSKDDIFASTNAYEKSCSYSSASGKVRTDMFSDRFVYSKISQEGRRGGEENAELKDKEHVNISKQYNRSASAKSTELDTDSEAPRSPAGHFDHLRSYRDSCSSCVSDSSHQDYSTTTTTASATFHRNNNISGRGAGAAAAAAGVAELTRANVTQQQSELLSLSKSRSNHQAAAATIEEGVGGGEGGLTLGVRVPVHRLVSSDTSDTLSTDRDTSCSSSKRESSTSTATDDTLTSFKTGSTTNSADFGDSFVLPQTLVFVRSSDRGAAARGLAEEASRDSEQSCCPFESEQTTIKRKLVSQGRVSAEEEEEEDDAGACGGGGGGGAGVRVAENALSSKGSRKKRRKGLQVQSQIITSSRSRPAADDDSGTLTLTRRRARARDVYSDAISDDTADYFSSKDALSSDFLPSSRDDVSDLPSSRDDISDLPSSRDDISDLPSSRDDISDLHSSRDELSDFRFRGSGAADSGVSKRVFYRSDHQPAPSPPVFIYKPLPPSSSSSSSSVNSKPSSSSSANSKPSSSSSARADQNPEKTPTTTRTSSAIQRSEFYSSSFRTPVATTPPTPQSSRDRDSCRSSPSSDASAKIPRQMVVVNSRQFPSVEPRRGGSSCSSLSPATARRRLVEVVSSDDDFMSAASSSPNRPRKRLTRSPAQVMTSESEGGGGSGGGGGGDDDDYIYSSSDGGGGGGGGGGGTVKSHDVVRRRKECTYVEKRGGDDVKRIGSGDVIPRLCDDVDGDVIVDRRGGGGGGGGGDENTVLRGAEIVDTRLYPFCADDEEEEVEGKQLPPFPLVHPAAVNEDTTRDGESAQLVFSSRTIYNSARHDPV